MEGKKHTVVIILESKVGKANKNMLSSLKKLILKRLLIN